MSEACRVLIQKQIWEISASSWFDIIYHDALSPERENDDIHLTVCSVMGMIGCLASD